MKCKIYLLAVPGVDQRSLAGGTESASFVRSVHLQGEIHGLGQGALGLPVHQPPVIVVALLCKFSK